MRERHRPRPPWWLHLWWWLRRLGRIAFLIIVGAGAVFSAVLGIAVTGESQDPASGGLALAPVLPWALMLVCISAGVVQVVRWHGTWK